MLSESVILKKNMIPEEQYGFMKNYSAIRQIPKSRHHKWTSINYVS